MLWLFLLIHSGITKFSEEKIIKKRDCAQFVLELYCRLIGIASRICSEQCFAKKT